MENHQAKPLFVIKKVTSKGANGLISVIIPCFNQVQFLGDAIESIVKQTYAKWECLIIDDGSTDESYKVAQRYIKTDSRIKYFKRTKEGVSAARNFGIKASNGEFIQFLDADDLLQNEKLFYGADALKKGSNFDAIVFDARYFQSNNPEDLKYNIFDNEEWMESAWVDNKDILLKFLDRNLMPINSPILRRSLIDNAGYFDESLSFCEDWDFWIRCVATSAHFYFLSCPNTFAMIRTHEGSASRNRRQMFQAEYRVILKAAKLFKKDTLITDLCYNIALSRLRKNLRNWSLFDILQLAHTFSIKKIYKILPQIFCERHEVIRTLLHPGKSALITEFYYAEKKWCEKYLTIRANILKVLVSLQLSEHEFIFHLLKYIETDRYSTASLKPFAGFHPGIFAERNNRDPVEGVLQFLDKGCPDGPWKHKVINLQSSQFNEAETLRCALHIHMHYLDDLKEIYKRLRGLRYTLDIFISITEDSSNEEVSNIFAQYRHGKVCVRRFENIGRNFGPFFSGFSNELINYDVIGHMHGKKSPNVKDRFFLDNWKRWLYNNLLGHDSAMANVAISEFINNKKTGAIFPDDRIIYGWGKNKSSAIQLAKSLNTSTDIINDNSILFPVGAMFWARREAIQPLFDLKLAWSDYPPEPIPTDGTILHTLERIIPFVVTSKGFNIVLTDVDFYSRIQPNNFQ